MLSFSCKAQQTYPLDTDFRTIPNNAYLKDINNELFPYMGIWKAVENNKETLIKVDKINHYFIKSGNRAYYQDVLFIRYSVKNSQGSIVKSTMNLSVYKIKSHRYNKIRKLVNLFYQGVLCGVGWGGIELKMVDPKHFTWNYFPEHSYTDKCGNNADFTVHLPEVKDLIFTKQ